MYIYELSDGASYGGAQLICIHIYCLGFVCVFLILTGAVPLGVIEKQRELQMDWLSQPDAWYFTGRLERGKVFHCVLQLPVLLAVILVGPISLSLSMAVGLVRMCMF